MFNLFIGFKGFLLQKGMIIFKEFRLRHLDIKVLDLRH